MKKHFTVGEAAKAAHTTSETLRHYDRIGLVKPSRKDEWTNYRYYTEADIVRLNTVRALQSMDLPLKDIKAVLEYEDLEKIVAFLSQAEQKADEKIAALQRSKARIQAAKADYLQKLRQQKLSEGAVLREFPERVLLLSDALETPTLETLWSYLRHFYEQVPPELRERFAFEDAAGLYSEQGTTRLFAVCTRYAPVEGLKVLPAGKYLCAACSEETREATLRDLLRTARAAYGAAPNFTVQRILVSGILHWTYEAQIYVGDAACP